MANDSIEIKSVLDFHPCDTPRGMLYYNLSELTDDQQKHLNDHKLDVIRENQQYLSDHPEIRIVTSMILKAILKERPKVNVQDYLAKYLMESWPDIKKEIDRCDAERELKDAMNRVMPSEISILKTLQLEQGEGFSEEEIGILQGDDFTTILPQPPHAMVRTILDDLIEKLADDEERKEAEAANALRKHGSSDFSLQSFITFPGHFSPTTGANIFHDLEDL